MKRVQSVGKLLCVSVLVGLALPQLMAQPNVQGQWTTIRSQTGSVFPMPINPIHATLLNTGKVLVVAGSGNYPPNKNYQAAVWDPNFKTAPIPVWTVTWDMFCNGAVALADGRVFINGGTTQYNPFHGAANTSVFDPVNSSFTDLPRVAHGRWYPTVTTLGDGRILTFSGLNEIGITNTAVEIFTPTSNTWSPEYKAGWTPPLYPRLHLLPNGNVFYSGSTTKSRYYYPSTHTWGVIATTNYASTRTYGSSVLLPLTPPNYKPMVMIMGGGNSSTATNTTEIIDLSATTPAWAWGPSMSQQRIEMNAVILPTGKILALGGSATDENASTASLNADLFSPDPNNPNQYILSSAGKNAYPRLYHSVALLLPDATVWLAGSNPVRGTYDISMEIYQPAYLFNPDGSLAPRPTITSAPSVVGYGGTFTVQTPNAANISSVVLIKAGSVTHAFDMDQRLVGLSYTVGSGSLTVAGPPSSNIAPPGYYLLFLLNSAGVPSVARFVQVATGPDFSITTAPPQRGILLGATATYTVQVVPSAGFGGTVNLSVIGVPSGATANFSPTSITGRGSSTLSVNTSGLIVTSYPGIYPLTVKGTSGTLTRSANTVNLIVNSPGDFSLSASPTSFTVPKGSSNQSTITVSPSGNFVGAVNFTVAGLPGPNVTASFSPASVTGSGSTTLTVQATSTAGTSTSKLTITGTSGTIVHSTVVTVSVQ